MLKCEKYCHTQIPYITSILSTPLLYTKYYYNWVYIKITRQSQLKFIVINYCSLEHISVKAAILYSREDGQVGLNIL
jgi:hypothetical protein